MWGGVGANPCRVKNAGVERSPERPIPTGDEVWTLAASVDKRFRALVLMVAFGGLRWGEVIALRRGDFDEGERMVHISRSFVELDGDVIEGPPKSAAGVRSVSLPPVLAVEVKAHLDKYVGADAEALVFTGAKGAPLRRSNFAPKWNAARTAAGRADLHLHDLRHFASVLASSAGASTRELMLRLGHSSPAAALRYQHATAERDVEIARRMDAMLTGAKDATTPTLRVIKGA